MALVYVVAVVGVASVLGRGAVVGVAVTVTAVEEVVLVAGPHPSAKPVARTSNKPVNRKSLIFPLQRERIRPECRSNQQLMLGKSCNVMMF